MFKCYKTKIFFKREKFLPPHFLSFSRTFISLYSINNCQHYQLYLVLSLRTLAEKNKHLITITLQLHANMCACMYSYIYLLQKFGSHGIKNLTHSEHLSRNKQETSVSDMVAYHYFAAMMKWKLKFHYEENTALD